METLEQTVSEEKPAYFGILPAKVRYDNRLSPYAKLIYSEFTALSNKYGYTFATNKYFAELYEVSETSISKYIKSLADCGYIKIEITRNSKNKFITERRISIISSALEVTDTEVKPDLEATLKPEHKQDCKPEHKRSFRSNNNNINNKNNNINTSPDSISDTSSENKESEDNTSSSKESPFVDSLYFPTEEQINKDALASPSEKASSEAKAKKTTSVPKDVTMAIYRKWAGYFGKFNKSAIIPDFINFTRRYNKSLIKPRLDTYSLEQILKVIDLATKDNWCTSNGFYIYQILGENKMEALLNGNINTNKPKSKGVNIDYGNQDYSEGGF